MNSHRAYPPKKRRMIIGGAVAISLGIASSVGIGAALAPRDVAAAVAPAAPVVAVAVHHPTKFSRPVTFQAVGDSFTALEYNGAPRGELSWLNWTSPNVKYVGGFSQSGFETWQMYTHFTPTASDVLVIMAGTNEVNRKLNPAYSMLYYNLMAAESSPARVIVSAIGPSNLHPAENLAYNVTLAEHAAAMGWVYVDPWSWVRAGDGTYDKAWETIDGVHPSGTVQSVTGWVLSNAIANLGHSKRGI